MEVPSQVASGRCLPGILRERQRARASGSPTFPSSVGHFPPGPGAETDFPISNFPIPVVAETPSGPAHLRFHMKLDERPLESDTGRRASALRIDTPAWTRFWTRTRNSRARTRTAHRRQRKSQRLHRPRDAAAARRPYTMPSQVRTTLSHPPSPALPSPAPPSSLLIQCSLRFTNPTLPARRTGHATTK